MILKKNILKVRLNWPGFLLLLNDANTLNSTLHAQLDSEKVTSELSFTWFCLLCS
jgi:hypothetical protein